MRERRVRLQRLSMVSYSAIGTSASHGRLKSAVVLRSTACFRMIDIRSAHPVSTSPSVDRKSTRLNSSHGYISYAVFCLKKKKRKQQSLCSLPYYSNRRHQG